MKVRKAIAGALMVAVAGTAAWQGDTMIRESYGFGGVGANATFAQIKGDANDATLEFRFSDTVEYSMTASTLDLQSNTLTVNDTVYTLPSAASAAATVGVHTVTWAQGGTAADALDTQFFIADRAYTVTEINIVWGTEEATGAMDVMVERLQGTEACGSGDNLQAAVVDATGTANTVATPTLTGTATLLDLAAGNRLCVDLSATPDEVANLVVTVTLQVN